MFLDQHLVYSDSSTTIVLLVKFLRSQDIMCMFHVVCSQAHSAWLQHDSGCHSLQISTSTWVGHAIIVSVYGLISPVRDTKSGVRNCDNRSSATKTSTRYSMPVSLALFYPRAWSRKCVYIIITSMRYEVPPSSLEGFVCSLSVVQQGSIFQPITLYICAKFVNIMIVVHQVMKHPLTLTS